MSTWTEVPTWVWDLLDALADYEDEHPLLYRMTDSDKYELAVCFGGFLSERKVWPPRDIQDAAEFRRHVLRENRPTATREPPPVAEPTTAERASAAQAAINTMFSNLERAHLTAAAQPPTPPTTDQRGANDE